MDTDAPAPKASEFEVMRSVNDQLEMLSDEERARTLSWLFSKFGAPQAPAIRQPKAPTFQDEFEDDEREVKPRQSAAFATFADLFAAASPKSQMDKSLVGGYWLQICEGAEAFASQAINDNLKNLGEGVGNVTQALDGLKSAKPALILQIKKSGKSKQSRKTYKLTHAGVKTVEDWIANNSAEA